MIELLATPIGSKPLCSHKTRERKWVELHGESHMTLNKICRLTGLTNTNALSVLPKPDKVYPSGNRTRLWLIGDVEKLMQ